jgi:hypothetical protein
MPTQQQLCNSFYDMANVVTIKVTMPAADWTSLKDAQPVGGTCNFAFTGDRYSWFTATSVEITGSAFPAGGAHTFSNVGIIKKSFCGSFSTTKPSLKLDISKFAAANEAIVEALIGTHHITLNNCIQDPAYIRQPLGFALFKQAGIPYSRCNFAKLYVNNVYYGVYLNFEPIKKRFIQNNFNNNDNGNLYEIEAGEDFDQATINANRISFEGFSNFTNKADLQLATSQIINNGLTGMASVINTNQFLKVFAMEVLLKHWDGYTIGRNNTFIYNDVTAVATPGVANVDFKFIPTGIDQILQENRKFKLSGASALGQLIRNDANSLSNLKTEIRILCNTIFDRDNYNSVLLPFINQMENVLTGMGVTGLTAHINSVRQQLKLVKSGGFQILNEFPLDSAFLLDKATGNCIHASNTEFIGTPGGHQEIYHYAPTTSRSDRWNILPAATAGTYKFTNRKYGRYLHASVTRYTLGGNLNIYNFLYDPTIGNDFFAEPVDRVSQWEVSGYFKLKSARTSLYVFLSAVDLTPLGRKQVHQISSAASATTLYLF